MAHPGPELMEICPYDKSHKVRRSILATHLFRCERNHPNKKLERCSFNSNHRVPLAELKDHQANCPNRHSFEASLFDVKGESSLSIPIEHIEVASTEDWDDGAVGGFDPNKPRASDDQENFIIRMKPCLAPAARKAFRNQQIADAKEFEAKRELFAPAVPPVKKTRPSGDAPRHPTTLPKAINKCVDSLKKVDMNEQKPPSLPQAESSASLPQEPQPVLPAAASPAAVSPASFGQVGCEGRKPGLLESEQAPPALLGSGRGRVLAALLRGPQANVNNRAMPLTFGRGIRLG